MEDSGIVGSERGGRGWASAAAGRVPVGQRLVGGGQGGRRGLVGALRDADEQAVHDQQLAGATGHRGGPQFALPGSRGGQHEVGVLRDRAVRAAGDGDGGGAVVEGGPQRLDHVVRGAGVGDGQRHVAGAQLHGVGDGQVRVGVRVRDQTDPQQLLRQVLRDQARGRDPVDVGAAGGGQRGDGGLQLDHVELRRRCRRGSAAPPGRAW